MALSPKVLETEYPVTDKIGSKLIDTDAHIWETLDDLVPFIDDEEVRQYAGGSSDLGFNNIYPWDGWDRTAGGRINQGERVIRNADDELTKMEHFGIDVSVLFPTLNLYHGLINTTHFAVELGKAYNRYLEAEYLAGNDNLKGAILVPHHDIDAAVEEIKKYGGDDDWVSVFLPPVGPDDALGNPKYHPIFEMAEKYGLPVSLHGGAFTANTFPLQTDYFETFLEVHAVSHPFQQLTQITSILCQGVLEKYDDLKIVAMEAGLSWIPVIYRLDKEYQARRNEAPLLTRLPSEYFREQIYVTAQPIEEISEFDGVSYLAEFAGGWDKLMFSTDWPHWDFDSPEVVNAYVPKEKRADIFYDTARTVYDIDI